MNALKKPLCSISRKLLFYVCALVLIPALGLSAQAINNATIPSQTPSPKPSSDVLVFANGDQMTGHLQRVSGETVYFETDGTGTLKIAWSKIKELRSEQPFAILSTTTKVRRRHANAMIPVGSFRMTNGQVTVHTAKGDQTLPVAKITYIVDEPTFHRDVEHTPGLLHGWAGSVTGGASLVNSTQNETTYNAAIALTHSIPTEAWLPADNRTELDFTSTYGKITQPNTPTVKTNIFHALAEQDQYISARFYILAHSIFDHNYAQGLDLQQTYGGGFGYSAIKRPKQTLDVTATLDYTKQQFQTSSSNQNLFGSTFANSYMRKLPRSIVLTEISSITPEWNNMNAYSANSSVGLEMPVFKKLSFSVQVIDSYLNNPPPGFKANSLQINTGITYTLP